MIYLLALGLYLAVSAEERISAEVRQALPPRDLDRIYAEQQTQKIWAKILILIAVFYFTVRLICDS